MLFVDSTPHVLEVVRGKKVSKLVLLISLNLSHLHTVLHVHIHIQPILDCEHARL